jgi:hypothetical protein
MRLPSQKLPKHVHKKARSVKHKDSEAMRQRREQRQAKKQGAVETMEVETDHDVVMANTAANATVTEASATAIQSDKKKNRVAYKHIPRRR